MLKLQLEKNSAQKALIDDRSPLETFSESIADSWSIIFISVGIASFLALLWLFFIPFVSVSIIWITIWSALISSIVCTAITWVQYYESITSSDFDFMNQFDFFTASEDILLALAIFSSLFFIFMILFMYFCYPRMDLAIQIIDEASNFLKDIQIVFFIPLINYILVGLLFFWSILVISLLLFCKDQVVARVAEVISSHISPIDVPSHRYV